MKQVEGKNAPHASVAKKYSVLGAIIGAVVGFLCFEAVQGMVVVVWGAVLYIGLFSGVTAGLVLGSIVGALVDMRARSRAQTKP